MRSKNIKRLARKGAFHANHRLRKYHNKLWLIGDGRSGTTWVSNLINSDQYFREMFEPFHPILEERMNFFSSHHYIRPGEQEEQFKSIASKVFEGKIFARRIDQDNRIGMFQGLLIKDIFANLFSNWAYRQFQDIKIILLLRNPFATALSKYEKRNWKWVTDPL